MSIILLCSRRATTKSSFEGVVFFSTGFYSHAQYREGRILAPTAKTKRLPVQTLRFALKTNHRPPGFLRRRPESSGGYPYQLSPEVKSVAARAVRPSGGWARLARGHDASAISGKGEKIHFPGHPSLAVLSRLDRGEDATFQRTVEGDGNAVKRVYRL